MLYRLARSPLTQRDWKVTGCFGLVRSAISAQAQSLLLCPALSPSALSWGAPRKSGGTIKNWNLCPDFWNASGATDVLCDQWHEPNVIQCLYCLEKMLFHSYIVPHWIDDGDVALQCGDENSPRRRDQENPERSAREPDATNEMVVGAATWHTSAVHLDNCDQQREERCTQVYDALVHDQNVYRLNKQRVIEFI